MGSFSCGIQDLVHNQGLKHAHPILRAWSLGHWTTRKSITEHFKLTLENNCSEEDFFQNITSQWQCTWSPKNSDGDVQRDQCVFHACTNTASILQHGSRSNFNFQVLFAKKYTKSIAAIDRLWWIWNEVNWKLSGKDSPLCCCCC